MDFLVSSTNRIQITSAVLGSQVIFSQTDAMHLCVKMSVGLNFLPLHSQAQSLYMHSLCCMLSRDPILSLNPNSTPVACMHLNRMLKPYASYQINKNKLLFFEAEWMLLTALRSRQDCMYELKIKSSSTFLGCSVSVTQRTISASFR